MALQIWLPMTKDLRNQGLADVTVTNNGATFNSVGKLGGCYKTSSSGYLDLGYNGNQINSSSLSFGGWFKFNQSEISSAISGKTYTSSAKAATGNLIGNNSYGGISLQWNSNDMYTSGSFSSMSVQSCLRTSTNGARATSSYTLPFDTWIHIFLTYDKDGNTLGLWINGELKYSYTQIAFTDAASRNLILNWGAVAGGNGPSAYIPFMVNDVRIYDHCLSPMEVKQISQGLVLHYPLNRNGWGQENFILESHKVTSGGQASGITRTYESDGSMKIVSTSGNGSWCSLGFAKDSNTSVGSNMTIGNTYCISCDIKVETGTALPTLFINSGNGYKQLKPVNGSIVTNKWIRIYYTSTWADPGTQYGNISLHLGFSGAIGTYYFKNFKLEKGSIPTSWCPNSSDTLATTMGLNSTTEYDCSGFGNNGTRTGTFTWTSDTPKYQVSTYISNGSTNYIITPNLGLAGDMITMNFWFKSSNKSPGSGYHMPLESMGVGHYEISIYQTGVIRGGLYVNNTRYVDNGTSTKLTDGNWHMCTMTYDGTTIKRYVDAIMEKSSSVVGTLTTNPSFIIGKYGSSSSYYSKEMYISDVRIYATALSASDVQSLYQNCATIDPDGTIRGQIRS